MREIKLLLDDDVEFVTMQARVLDEEGFTTKEIKRIFNVSKDVFDMREQGGCRMSRLTYKNITLKEMLEDLVKWQLGEDNEYGGEFYYQDGDGNFDKIIEVDLMYSRFQTDDGDFSEYDGELEKSHIYVREEIQDWKVQNENRKSDGNDD